MKLAEMTGGKDKLKKTAGAVRDTAARQAKGARGAAAGKIDALMGALDETLLNVKTLGLTLKDFQLGSGVLPSVRATLEGSVDAVDPVRLAQMIDDHPDNEILQTTLKLLQSAVKYKDRLSVFDLTGIELSIKVGFPPDVSLRFI